MSIAGAAATGAGSRTQCRDGPSKPYAPNHPMVLVEDTSHLSHSSHSSVLSLPSTPPECTFRSVHDRYAFLMSPDNAPRVKMFETSILHDTDAVFPHQVIVLLNYQ